MVRSCRIKFGARRRCVVLLPMDVTEGPTDEDAPWCQQYVELAIETDDGDFNPDDVTALVGITPTHTARRGEVMGNGRPRRRSTWSFRLGEWRRAFDTEELVCELLDVLDHHRTALAHLPDSGLSPGLSLVIEMYSVHDDEGEVMVSTPALSLGSHTIRRMADMNLSLWCDQYVL